MSIKQTKEFLALNAHSRSWLGGWMLTQRGTFIFRIKFKLDSVSLTSCSWRRFRCGWNMSSYRKYRYIVCVCSCVFLCVFMYLRTSCEIPCLCSSQFSIKYWYQADTTFDLEFYFLPHARHLQKQAGAERCFQFMLFFYCFVLFWSQSLLLYKCAEFKSFSFIKFTFTIL